MLTTVTMRAPRKHASARPWGEGLLQALLLLVAATFASPAHSQTAAPSLLTNGGFENGVAGWTQFGHVEIAQWAKETGTAGATMQGWVLNAEGGFFQDVSGAPGMTYTFSARAKKEALFQAAKVYVTLEFYTADKVTKAGHNQGTLNVSTLLTTNWQTFTISGTAPLGTVYVRPVIRFEGATSGDLGTGKQACFWDNAELIASGP